MTLRTFSFGGGVQSTAVLALAAAGEVSYDAYLFCNVGDHAENPETLKYVHEVSMPFAREHGLNLIEIQRVRRDGTPVDLFDMMTTLPRSLPIPIHSASGLGKRACTIDFKIKVIAKWQKQHGATKDQPAIAGLGISLDEIHRARTDSGIPHQVLEYPLLDRRLRRNDCARIIREAGLPVAPKSSCWFCPFHSPHGWRLMRHDNPEQFERASELDEFLRERNLSQGKLPVYLSGVKIPLRDAFGGDQMSLDDMEDDPGCNSGSCWT